MTESGEACAALTMWGVAVRAPALCGARRPRVCCLPGAPVRCASHAPPQQHKNRARLGIEARSPEVRARRALQRARGRGTPPPLPPEPHGCLQDDRCQHLGAGPNDRVCRSPCCRAAPVVLFPVISISICLCLLLAREKNVSIFLETRLSLESNRYITLVCSHVTKSHTGPSDLISYVG